MTEAQRRKALLRMWEEAEPAPVPLVAAERAWMLTLTVPPSAPGAMDDDRVYIPLRKDMLVALDRESGALQWTRTIDTVTPPLAADRALFAVNRGEVRSLDTTTGEDRWITRLDARVVAPLVWDAGWLLVIVESDDADEAEIVALRAADGAVIWRQPLGAPTSHAPVPGGDNALYLSLDDGTLLALSLVDGRRLWSQRLPGTISPPAVARGRVYVGSTDNFFYAFDDEEGGLAWKWRGGGDVIGAATDEDLVYFASLDNIIRAVNRGNGNQRWKMPTGTRPILPPVTFGGIVVLAGLSPTITVFASATGDLIGTHEAPGELMGGPLLDRTPEPFAVALVTITREGVVEALRPTALLFREAATTPLAELPGRPLPGEAAP